MEIDEHKLWNTMNNLNFIKEYLKENLIEELPNCFWEMLDESIIDVETVVKTESNSYFLGVGKLKFENMSNIGRIIKDGYCNGFFGRDYDFHNSVIIAEGDEYIVIRKENGIVEFGNFQSWDWNRNDDGTLSYGISNLQCMSSEKKQELIDNWCGEF